jgi:hypothetical protein
MFQAICPTCQRTYLSRTGNFGRTKCCGQGLPSPVPYVEKRLPTATVKTTRKSIVHSAPIPCVHRGQKVGRLDCGCNGEREVYRCTRLIRPTAATESAYCTAYQPAKYFGINLLDGTKLSSDEVPFREIVVCQPGRCDLYQPAIPVPKPLPAS